MKTESIEEEIVKIEERISSNNVIILQINKQRELINDRYSIIQVTIDDYQADLFDLKEQFNELAINRSLYEDENESWENKIQTIKNNSISCCLRCPNNKDFNNCKKEDQTRCPFKQLNLINFIQVI